MFYGGSKCIDFAIAKFISINIIEINLFGITLSNKREKIINFVKNYICFTDKNKLTIMINGV
jgi:hypothetical protein